MTTFTLPYQSVQAPREYAGYLQALWNLQQVRYEVNWRLYTGEAWLEVDTRRKDRDGEPRRKYRLGVNDIALACNMHAQLLFGEVRDSSDPLVSFKVKGRKGQKIGEGSIEQAQNFLDELWGESSSRKLHASECCDTGAKWRRFRLPHEATCQRNA